MSAASGKDEGGTPTRRPFAWEKSYPAGVRWDAPIEVTTLPELLARAVAAYGPKPALEYGGSCITYEELQIAAARVANGLIALGITPGTAVATYLPNTPYHPMAFFGVLQAGARVMQLSPLDAERELVYKLRDSGARALITTDIGPLPAMAAKLLAGGHLDWLIVGNEELWDRSHVAPPLPAGDERVLTMAELFARGAGVTRSAWPEIVPNDIALLQYTGGTTGVSKGAVLTHANMTAAVAMANAWSRPLGITIPGQGRIICVLPLFHIYALNSVLLRGLSNGAEILLRARFDTAATLQDIEVRRATSFPAVPTMLIALAAVPNIERRDISSLRSLSSGGAPLPVEVAERIERLSGRPLLGGWGMTETCPAGTQIPPGRPDKRGTIGVPLPGIEMEVVALDDPRRVLGPGETGEFRIRGANVTSGYWRRPEETAAAFVHGWFLTGDVGTMDTDGFFFLVDRKKDMIISGGFNVYPRVVEEAIYEHPGVEEAIVIGVADAYRGEAAKAFVKLKPGAPPFALEDLRSFLADKAGRHEVPAALEFREALPRTSVGKLSKRELVEEERRKARSG